MTDELDPPIAAIGSDAPKAPSTYVQGEAVTLLSILDGLREVGFSGQFDERDGQVRCLTCRQSSPAETVEVFETRRLEGASDPADSLVVMAVRCPRCSAQGALVLNYGAEATAGDSEVLRSLPEPDTD